MDEFQWSLSRAETIFYKKMYGKILFLKKCPPFCSDLIVLVVAVASKWIGAE